LKICIDSPVSTLRGVGPAKSASLAAAGIVTIKDLLHYYPRAYQNKADIKTLADAAVLCSQPLPAEPGGAEKKLSAPPCAFLLTVAGEPIYKVIRRGMSILRFRAFDETGVCEITYFNQPYLRDVFHTGSTFRFWGRPTMERGVLKLTAPVQEVWTEDTVLPPIVPVYPLCAGLTQKYLASLIRDGLKAAAVQMTDHLPPNVLQANNLCTLGFAITNIHFPESLEALESARRRFAFDELFCTAAAMAYIKTGKRGEAAPLLTKNDLAPLLAKFPYKLTGAQQRAAEEIAADLGSGTPMCRILCGDVGSGKTAVAACAAYIALQNGYQCALMAPTEILAQQHYSELGPLFESLGYRVALLTGSVPAAQKRKIHAALAGDADRVDFVIGTHALLSEAVSFSALGLVITDEQHRFGVNQRALLREKAGQAHTLVMSATPIPRTLSLVLFGDLDISRLDEMPPGRQKIDTFAVNEGYRTRLIGFIRKQKEAGHRTYVVCPAIEESQKKKKPAENTEELSNIDFFTEAVEELPLKSATEHAAMLQSMLPELNVGLVHGKMKAAEKERAMDAFYKGESDVLVSTTVIEVGVNVPQATLMIVENAERFGLAQLHQLRGRVGRGKAKSYCVLVSDAVTDTSRQRLSVMCRTNDGFQIAEEDLRLRGPGDFFSSEGTFRQHGGPALVFSANCSDTTLISAAVQAAGTLIAVDPDLALPENRLLGVYISHIMQSSLHTIS
jgi:ATP-dependent DNA helicase RecG